MTKWLGASGGRLCRQFFIRSPRTTVSSSSAISPSASAPICRLDASGRRRRLARPKRQVTPRCGRRFSTTISSHATIGRRDEQTGDAADHDAGGLDVLRLPADQERDDRRAEPVGDDGARSRPRQVAAQHAQRRDRRQRDQRRQREPEQQQHAGAEGGHARQPCRRRQLGGGDAAQQLDQEFLPGESGEEADEARDHAERGELDDEQRERAALGRAEAAQHRRGVEVAPQVARCGKRDRDRGEDHRDQRREAEELLGTIERLPHLGPQVADVLHPLAGLQFLLQPREERLQQAALASRRRPAAGARPDCRAAAGSSPGRRRDG